MNLKRITQWAWTIVAFYLSIPAQAQDTMMYRGGFADGYSSLAYQVFYPESASLSSHTVYKGGSGDGYTHQSLPQFYPQPLTHAVMYTGGFGDGYSTEKQDHFTPEFLSHFAAYTADTNTRGDGYSALTHTDFSPGILDHHLMYAGGEGDGYAGHLVLSYQPLPVGLISFTGEIVNNRYSLLKWEITSEKDAARYELQRSADGLAFNSIHHQPVTDPSQIQVVRTHEDRRPMNGANYYRLLIHEKDGRVKLSNTILLIYRNGSESLVLFPNPANHSLNLRYELASAAQIRITDIKGTVLYQSAIPAGSQTVAIPVSAYAPGTYLLHMITEAQERSQVIRFLKQ